MKPTPGPWEIDDDSQRIDGIGAVRMYRVVAPSGAVVVEFSNSGCNEIVYEDDGEGCGVHYDEQAMANATLIAAAPELYDALHALFLQSLQSTVATPANEYGHEALSKAKAALAKARGEQHS